MVLVFPHRNNVTLILTTLNLIFILAEMSDLYVWIFKFFEREDTLWIERY